MTDICNTCSLKGMPLRCQEEECHVHETWYATTLRNDMNALKAENALLKAGAEPELCGTFTTT